MFRLPSLKSAKYSTIPSSKLYSNVTFYDAFYTDLRYAQNEVIIESPFITTSRFNELLPILKKLRRKGIDITINTRDPEEHEGIYIQQAYDAVEIMQDLGIKVLYTTKLHRKIAIIDRKIIWEGSLNILSFTDSCEMMRRINNKNISLELIKFLSIYNYYKIL